MTKLFAGLFATVLLIGLGSTPMPSYAEEDATDEGKGTATESGQDETMIEKLEDELEKDFKEEPTDNATDPIAADEDSDGDLF